MPAQKRKSLSNRLSGPRLISLNQLLDLVWGRSIHVGPRTVDMHVSNLRKALEAAGHDRLIQTVRGTGYRLSVRGQP